MTAPALVPWFYDREFYSRAPVSALLARRLGRFQQWALGRMTRLAPADQVTYVGPYRYLYNSNGTALAWSNRSFMVPLPPFPARRLKVWMGDSGSYGGNPTPTYYLVSRRSGLVLGTIAFAGSGGWRTTTITVDAPDIIDVYGTTGTPSATMWGVTGVHAYWLPADDLPSGVTVDTAWSAISQSFLASGRADSAYVLRWLGRKANQLIAERAPQILAAPIAPAPVNGGGGFMVRVGARVPSLTVKVYARASAARSLFITYVTDEDFGHYWSTIWDSSTSTQAVPGTSTWAWYTFTVPCGFSAARVIRLGPRTTSDLSIDIGSIAIWEDPPTASDLALPGAETIPASFATLNDAALLSGTPIRADLDGGSSAALGRAALVRNMVYLWSKKVRQLACYSPFASLLYSGAGSEPLLSTLGLYWFRATPDGWTKQIRLRGASSGASAGIDDHYLAWAQWRADNGGASSWAELEKEYPDPVLATLQDGSRAMASWRSIEDHSVASGADFVFRRRWGNPSSDPTPLVSHLGAFIEEMPSGTPTTSWP